VYQFISYFVALDTPFDTLLLRHLKNN